MNETSPSNSANGNHQRPAVDVLEDPQQSGTFYDPSNPLLAAPKPIDKTRHKNRKRRLITISFLLLALVGVSLILYRLLGVDRVNVSVQAVSPGDAQSARNRSDYNGSDNSLSTDAVNITRQALGSDDATSDVTSTPSPTSTPYETNSTAHGLPSLSGTVYQREANEVGSAAKTDPASRTGPALDHANSGANSASPALAQSRANATQTIYVEDSPPRIAQTANSISGPARRVEKMPAPKPAASPPELPPFGTMLPVRTQGVIFTLRNNSYARLELVRDMKGSGWSLPKGTVLIGKANGSEYDRAFITVIGYIDSRDNRLVKLSGEVLGSDGGSGIQGKRVVVDSGGLKRALSKIASSGVQAAGLLASSLGGQRTVILDGAGNRIISPISDEATRMFGGANGDKRAFVKVEAGRPAYVMVADLPKERSTIDAPVEDELRQSGSLTNRELMELLLFGTRDEIAAAIPTMTDEQKALALKALTPANEKK